MVSRVGCASVVNVSAEEVSVDPDGMASPYIVDIFISEVLPNGLRFSKNEPGKITDGELTFEPSRGMEGSVITVCLNGGEIRMVAKYSLPRACVQFTVLRCIYCLKESETLSSVAKTLTIGSNWCARRWCFLWSSLS